MAGLNKTEFDSLVGLLARAHYNGDSSLLEQHVGRAYDDLVRQSGIPLQELPAGAMTDGAKRRLTPDTAVNLDNFDGFEFVENPDDIQAHKLELEAIDDEIGSADPPTMVLP